MSRQLVEISIAIKTTEYHADIWRNRKTGTCAHDPFPEGVTNDVNYGGSVKAVAFLLGNECNVSHHKVKKFLSEVTGGELEISVGMINGLCEEFSAKTRVEKAAILDIGDQEYLDNPPGDCYREGYNLCKRLRVNLVVLFLF